VAELFDSDDEFAKASKLSKTDLAEQRARDKDARKKKKAVLEGDADFAALDNLMSKAPANGGGKCHLSFHACVGAHGAAAVPFALRQPHSTSCVFTRHHPI
jgi:hypothetical protein